MSHGSAACDGCLGSGQCWVCLGTGSFDMRHRSGACTRCAGSGLCTVCRPKPMVIRVPDQRLTLPTGITLATADA